MEQISLGHLDHNQNLWIQNFNLTSDNTSEKLIGPFPFQDIDPQMPDLKSLDTLFIENSNSVHEVQKLIEKGPNHFPIFASADFDLDEQTFSSLKSDRALSIYAQSQRLYALENNLMLLKTLIPLGQRLCQLRHQNYQLYFEDLWRIVKDNLAASYLKIIYHDLKETGTSTENQNFRLACKIIHGRHQSSFEDGDQAAQKILAAYNHEEGTAKNGSGVFRLIENHHFNQEDISFVGKIGHGKALFMAKAAHKMDRLQEALLESFFHALQLKP